MGVFKNRKGFGLDMKQAARIRPSNNSQGVAWKRWLRNPWETLKAVLVEEGVPKMTEMHLSDFMFFGLLSFFSLSYGLLLCMLYCP